MGANKDVGQPHIRLAEEAAELIQALMKFESFGPTPEQNGVRYNNILDIEKEMRDVEYQIRRCHAMFEKYHVRGF